MLQNMKMNISDTRKRGMPYDGAPFVSVFSFSGLSILRIRGMPRQRRIRQAGGWSRGQSTVTSLSCITRFIICDRDVEELTKCCTCIIKHGHSARNNMRWVPVI